jgi:hypothetical protein
MKDGTKLLYEVGELLYSDVFGGRHVTKFFLYQATPDNQLMSSCEEGNSMN